MKRRRVWKKLGALATCCLAGVLAVSQGAAEADEASAIKAWLRPSAILLDVSGYYPEDVTDVILDGRSIFENINGALESDDGILRETRDGFRLVAPLEEGPSRAGAGRVEIELLYQVLVKVPVSAEPPGEEMARLQDGGEESLSGSGAILLGESPTGSDNLVSFVEPGEPCEAPPDAVVEAPPLLASSQPSSR